MSKLTIPPDLQELYKYLKNYLYECSCDEVEPDWPTATCVRLIERIAGLEAKETK
jgi:hypothetical protein